MLTKIDVTASDKIADTICTTLEDGKVTEVDASAHYLFREGKARIILSGKEGKFDVLTKVISHVIGDTETSIILKTFLHSIKEKREDEFPVDIRPLLKDYQRIIHGSSNEE